MASQSITNTTVAWVASGLDRYRHILFRRTCNRYGTAVEDIGVWNHETRFEALADVHRLTKARASYHTLYDLSRKVRYSANPDLWIPPADIESKEIGRHLSPLEESVQKVIGRDLKLPTINLSHLVPVPKQYI